VIRRAPPGYRYLLPLLLFAGGFAQAPPDVPALVEIAYGKDPQGVLATLIAERVDIVGIDRAEHTVQVAVRAAELQRLRELGFQLRVIFEDVNLELRWNRYGADAARRLPSGELVVTDSTLGPYHTYTEMTAELQQLAAEHPELVRLDTLGISLEGRIIWGLKISDQVNQEEADEPEVLYLGNHHARELISVEIPLHFAHYLVEQYGQSERVTAIVDSRQIWIVPMVNPDGHVYVETTDLMWRKNRRNNGDGTFGVDLNRNYSYQWGYDDAGSSPNGGDYNYRGTAPFSEPETRAVRDLVEAHQFVFCFTYHAYGNDYIYPWNYINAYTPDHPIFHHGAIRFGVTNNYARGNSMETIAYPMNGEATDWLYGERGVFAYTVEVGTGNDGFHPDTSRIVPLIQQNLEPNLLLAELADNPAQVVPLLPQPTLKTVVSTDANTVRIRWESITSPALLGYRLLEQAGTDGSAEWIISMDETVLVPGTDSATVAVQGPAYFRLVAVDTTESEGLSYASDTYGADGSEPGETVLIVDGFDRNNGSWTQVAHPFARTTGAAITAAGWNFHTCANEAVVDGTVRLEDYPVVVWLLGDESTQDETFSAAEQEVVAAYLEGGGRLFVSGSEIGWDLVARGTAADQQFYTEYLKAVYLADDSQILSVTGLPGSIFAGVAADYGDPSQGSPYAENYPDVIAPDGGSLACLTYPGLSDGHAAVQYAGTFGSGTVPGKCVYLAFPFETLQSAQDREAIMIRALEYLTAPLGIVSGGNPAGRFRLAPNIPNPFNNRTTIRYDLPERLPVRLTIYDLTGQEVAVLVNRTEEAGPHRVVWQAGTVASGIYFYRLAVGGRVITRKLTVLK
jgi:hypothetical protein